MRILLIFLISSLLFAFEVEYTKIYTQYIVPKNKAIKIITKKNGLTFPFPFVKTKDGYILFGDLDQINMWLNDDFYAPDDAKFETVNFTKVDYDKIQFKIIKKTEKTYKSCKIKKIVFLTPDEDKIITKPTTIKLKYKILLNCK